MRLKIRPKKNDTQKCKLRTIKEILMDRDGMTEQEADDRIEEVKEELEYVATGYDFPALQDLEDVIKEELGLEPDYLWELMPL